MFTLLRNRFGVPGLISVIALVFAMSGGAFAAKDYLSADSSATKQNKAGKPGPRGKRGKPGKPGKPGAPGAPGAQGPAGSAGPKGDKGDNGTNGTNGDDGGPGTNGKSVEVGAEATSTANCGGRGGAWVQVAGEPVGTRKFACNGAEGSPWTAGGVLPPGETETGTFSFSDDYPAETTVETAISFPISLTQADAEEIGKFGFGPGGLGFDNIHVLQPGEDETTNCPGTHLAPEAIPGKLCVYLAAGITGIDKQSFIAGEPFFVFAKPDGTPGLPGLGQSGGIMIGKTTATPGFVRAAGSWAVTASTP